MTTLTLTLLLTALSALCLLSAVMSALETALICLKEHQVASLAGNNESLREAIRRFTRRPRRHLNHVILLNTPLQLAIAAIILYLLRESDIPWGLEPVITALLFFGVVVLLTELLPTLLGASRPDTVFRLTARPLQVIDPLLQPVAQALTRITEKFTTLILPLRLKPRGDFSQEELETLVELRQDEGVLDEGEAEVIQEILKLGQKTAKDCMTPRVDAVVMSIELGPEDADRFVREQDHWHIPVSLEAPDNIVGILDTRALLFASSSGTAPAEIRDFIRPPVFVPETMPALEVFRNFLGQPHSLAIVLDEFGGLEGVIGQTDIIEEIIGEAAPNPRNQLEIQDLGRNRLLVTGSARLDEIGEILDLDLESEGLDTIGGLLFNAVDRLPGPGEKIALNGIVATVRRCSSRRIEEALIEIGDGKLKPPPQP